jgi:hypothetical protein
VLGAHGVGRMTKQGAGKWDLHRARFARFCHDIGTPMQSLIVLKAPDLAYEVRYGLAALRLHVSTPNDCGERPTGRASTCRSWPGPANLGST